MHHRREFRHLLGRGYLVVDFGDESFIADDLIDRPFTPLCNQGGDLDGPTGIVSVTRLHLTRRLVALPRQDSCRLRCDHLRAMIPEIAAGEYSAVRHRRTSGARRTSAERTARGPTECQSEARVSPIHR